MLGPAHPAPGLSRLPAASWEGTQRAAVSLRRGYGQTVKDKPSACKSDASDVNSPVLSGNLLPLTRGNSFIALGREAGGGETIPMNIFGR